MRVMVLVKATEESEAGLVADEERMAAMGVFNQALIDAGIFVTAAGLMPTSHGCRVAFDGDSRAVIQGPFTPARDQVTGFWIWEVEDLAQAEEWVLRCPNPMPVPSEIEIRPFHCL